MPFVPDLSDRLVQVGFPAALAEELQTVIQGPVSGAGIRTTPAPASDLLVAPVEHQSTTDAISTTVTSRVTPLATYRTARVSWVNNGASGSAKLNIAANCSNDVMGLVAAQSVKQRDAQMTMGDVLLIVSPTPITSLNFSSDTAIAADAHRLLVSFGA